MKNEEFIIAFIVLIIVSTFFVINSIIFEGISVSTLDNVCKGITDNTSAVYYQEIGFQYQFTCKIGDRINIYGGIKDGK